ncbi:steroid alpha reductase family protein [Aureobasidium pullulans]|nr:steroid alpha reductase family protein [Aureobasidium pullulans]
MTTITVVARGKHLSRLPCELPCAPTSARELYHQVSAASGLPIHRLRISSRPDGTGAITLAQDSLDLSDTRELFVKDLGKPFRHPTTARHALNNAIETGPQVSWRDVYIIEYLGALVAHPVIYVARLSHPTSVQTLLLALIIIHFIKRELETVFVHRFSNATMPLRNIFKNSFHYWILSGVMLAWVFYAPVDPAKSHLRGSDFLGLLIFSVGEIGNLYIHLILRGLRSQGTVERKIPHGIGFDWVTCPNYLYETIAWLGILVISRSWAVLLFMTVAVAQMWAWAWKKELRYRREFPNSYKFKKFVVLPGVC